MTQSLALEGRIAVVTGATSGIGDATARKLVAAGAKVAILGRREDRLKNLAYELGSNVLPIPVDVGSRDDLNIAAGRVRAELGRADLVVANAGVMLAAPFETAQVGEWDEMLRTNVTGLLNTGRAFADDLIAAAEEGKCADLVHIGSIGAHMIFPTYAVYTATKAAVAHLTRNLRAELGPRGVRVRNIEPGLTATELGHNMTDPAAIEFLAGFRDQVPSISPEAIADAIVYSSAAPVDVNVAEMIVLPTRQG